MPSDGNIILMPPLCRWIRRWINRKPSSYYSAVADRDRELTSKTSPSARCTRVISMNHRDRFYVPIAYRSVVDLSNRSMSIRCRSARLAKSLSARTRIEVFGMFIYIRRSRRTTKWQLRIIRCIIHTPLSRRRMPRDPGCELLVNELTY